MCFEVKCRLLAFYMLFFALISSLMRTYIGNRNKLNKPHKKHKLNHTINKKKSTQPTKPSHQWKVHR